MAISPGCKNQNSLLFIRLSHCAFFFTSVEAEETLIAQDFLGTVEAVLVHELSNKGASRALVLHPRLHQVDRVHRSRSRRYTHTKAQIIQCTLVTGVYKKQQLVVLILVQGV